MVTTTPSSMVMTMDIMSATPISCFMTLYRLGVYPDGSARLEAPQGEVDVVGCLHRRRRQLNARPDLGSQTACDVPADEHAHRVAQGSVVHAPLHQGLLGVEPLRVADGELEPVRSDSSMSSSASSRVSPIGFSRSTCLPALSAALRHRVVGRLRGGGDHHGLDVGVGHEAPGSRRWRWRRRSRLPPRQADPVGSRRDETDLTSGLSAAVTARMPPHQPVPITATSI